MENIGIETKQGALRGASWNGACVWKGVPYAKPPLGELRFRAPQAPEGWQGVRDALAFGPICPQPKPPETSLFGSDHPGMSEDCLYLNIWAPEGERTNLPVIVWIHGGSFTSGASSLPLYDGTQLALRGDCIVVTVNYRLGPLGFLHLAPLGEGFESNVGLLDQAAALKWVKEHIGAFGGDPGRVTVMGESAGSMSIAALLAMPAAKGLFHQAVMQSGGAQCLPAAAAESVSAAFLRRLGVDGGNLERLKAVSPEELLIAAAGLEESGEELPSLPFQPVVEPATLPVEPLEAVSAGEAAGIPLIIGTNRDEGHFFFMDESQRMGTEGFTGMLRALTGAEDVGDWLLRYPATLEGQADAMTDLYFWRSALAFAQAQAQHAPVWMYRFDWTLPGHVFFGKALHAAEIPFMFGNMVLLPRMGIRLEPAMQNLSDAMRGAWQAFAASGSPSTPILTWEPYDAQSRTTMIFDTSIVPQQDPEREKRERLFGLNVSN